MIALLILGAVVVCLLVANYWMGRDLKRLEKEIQILNDSSAKLERARLILEENPTTENLKMLQILLDESESLLKLVRHE